MELQYGAPDDPEGPSIGGVDNTADGRKAHCRWHSHSEVPSGAGAGAEKVTPRHGRVESGDVDDHMLTSLYFPDDICKGCGFPRKSSVWCPVTQRHHGTDELMAPTGHAKKGAGGLKFLKGVFSRVSPHHNSSRNCVSAGNSPSEAPAVRAAGLPPTVSHHQPPPGQETPGSSEVLAAEGEAHAGADPAGMASEADPNTQYVQGSDGYYYVYTPDTEGREEAPAPEGAEEEEEAPAPEGAEGAVEEGEGEGNVQYYCYTDENGDTFYYAAELQESMSLQRQQSHAGSAGSRSPSKTQADDGNRFDSDANANGGGGANPPLPESAEEGEGGNTVEHGAPNMAAGAVDPAQGSASVGLHAEEGVEGPKNPETPKKKKTFGDAISSLFKGKREKKEKDGKPISPGAAAAADNDGNRKHMDPNAPMSEAKENTSVEHVKSGRSNKADVAELSATELQRLQTVDSAIAGFVDGLDSAEKKKFDKERRKRVKELEALEKKERSHLSKQWKGFVEDLVRERRAGLFILQSEKKILQRGTEKGEPL